MQRRTKAHEQLDFEIGFYERLLQAHPDFPEALSALGEAYSRRGWYDKGLAIDLKLIQLKHHDPVVWYNLACSYSLLNRPEDSFKALNHAITLGYDDFEYLLKDPDLATLRRSPKLRALLTQRTQKTSS